MATNLKAKMGESDTLIIHDVNSESTKKFVEENPGTEVAQNVREVAEKSVCATPSPLYPARSLHDELFCSIYDLSWGLPRGSSFCDS